METTVSTSTQNKVKALLLKLSHFSKILLHTLEIFLNWLHILFKKYKYITIVFFFIILFGSVLLGRHTRLAIRTEDFGNPNMSSYRDMQELKGDYAMEDKLTLVFSQEKPFENTDYCRLYTWLKNQVNNNTMIAKASSGFDLRFVKQTEEGNLFYPKIFEDPCSGNIHFDQLKEHPLKYLFFIDSLSDFIIHFQINPETVPLKHGIYDYTHVKKIISDAKRELPYSLHIGGTLFFQSSVLDGVKQTGLLNIITALLFIAGYFYFYRSKLAIVALISIIVFTNSLVRASMYLSGQPIDPLASCIFFMLIVAIIEDYIFLSFLIFKKKMSFNGAIQKIILPSFLTSLTTAIGFGSLALSPNPNVVHFAIWTSLGSMLEWFIIFIVLPCFYELKPKKLDEVLKNIRTYSFDLKFLTNITPKRSVTRLLLIVFLVIPFVFSRANLNYSPYDMFDDSHSISDFRNYFHQTRNTEGEISIVFEKNATPSKEFLDRLNEIQGITKVMAMGDFVQALSSLDESLKRMIMSEIEVSELGKMFKSSSNHRLIAFTTSLNTKDITTLQNTINNLCQNLAHNQCKAVSEVIVSKDYAFGILSTLYNSFSFCFLLIMIIITWLTLAVDYTLLVPVLLSVMWAPIALLIVVVAMQFNINIITCVALSVIVGLGGDNAIQFLLVKKESLLETVKDFGQASLQTFILLAIVSASLVLSYFKTSKILSFLLLIGITLMLIGDIWVLNGLLKKKKAAQDERPS